MSNEFSPTYAIAVLVFGELGKSSEISLNSLAKFKNRTVCVLGDHSGITWISNTAKKLDIKNLCIHEPRQNDLSSLALHDLSNNKYSEFGKERFIKLTTFKWYLINDVLKKHKDYKFVLFSDLDVIWFKEPDFSLFDKDNEICPFVQDDSPLNKKSIHVCSGIMIWRNSIYSKNALNKMFEIQIQKNQGRFLVPDEPILNEYLISSSFHFKVLPKKEYVIGHRFFHLILNLGFQFKKINCYHANYAIGERNKLRRINAIMKRKEGKISWLYSLVFEILLRFH